MNIAELIRESNLKTYDKLNGIRRKAVGNISEREIKELMSHSSYRRSASGAIRQVR